MLRLSIIALLLAIFLMAGCSSNPFFGESLYSSPEKITYEDTVYSGLSISLPNFWFSKNSGSFSDVQNDVTFSLATESGSDVNVDEERDYIIAINDLVAAEMRFVQRAGNDSICSNYCTNKTSILDLPDLNKKYSSCMTECKSEWPDINYYSTEQLNEDSINRTSFFNNGLISDYHLFTLFCGVPVRVRMVFVLDSTKVPYSKAKEVMLKVKDSISCKDAQRFIEEDKRETEEKKYTAVVKFKQCLAVDGFSCFGTFEEENVKEICSNFPKIVYSSGLKENEDGTFTDPVVESGIGYTESISTQGSCYWSMARFFKKESYCDLLEYGSKFYCRAQFSTDQSYCDLQNNSSGPMDFIEFNQNVEFFRERKYLAVTGVSRCQIIIAKNTNQNNICDSVWEGDKSSCLEIMARS